MNNLKNKIISILNLFNKGEKQKALNEISLLIDSNKKNLDLLFLQAQMFIQINQIDKAIYSLKRILNLDPENIKALELTYGNYLKKYKYDHAENYIDKLLNIGSKKYELLRDKAFLEYLKKNYEDSRKFIEHAIKINKNDVFGLNILGLIYMEQNKIADGIKIFQKAISINPNYGDSYNNLGKCLIDIEKLNEAYICFKKANRINPNSDLSFINIANILSIKDKNKLALKFYKKAKKINPDNQITDQNIALIYCKLKNIDWVKKFYQKQKDLGIFNSEFILGYSYLLLNKKKFKEAFDLFESRLKTKDFPKKNQNHTNVMKNFNSTNKIELNSKILIVKEQGVGDEVLFSSLYNDLLKKHKNVKIECDKRLLKIFERSFKKDIFFPFGYFSSSKNKLGSFDKILYAGSLTKYYRKKEQDFNINPYLKTNKEVDNNIKLKLERFKNTKKIGISWKSVINIYGNLKSLKISDFESLFSKNRTLINLQYGNTDQEIKYLNDKGKNIFSFKNIDLFNDFESLLSILKNLDIFVTVSNSSAHFAGALGVPTILICPKKSSTYYYWDYENGKTPWYKSVSIVKFKNSTEYTMNLVNDLINKA